MLAHKARNKLFKEMLIFWLLDLNLAIFSVKTQFSLFDEKHTFGPKPLKFSDISLF